MDAPKPGVATIYFDDNVFHDPSDPFSSPYVATTDPNFLVAPKNSKVTWTIQRRGANDKFDSSKVDISFKAIFSPLKTKDHSNRDVITGQVKKSGEVFDLRYSYRVIYDGRVAQDPELDVKGDTVDNQAGKRGDR